jgi:hypothetical protein
MGLAKGVVFAMRCLVAMCLFCAVLFSALTPGPSPTGLAPLGSSQLQAQVSRTELMQQNDHKQRMERAKKAQAEGNQLATLVATESTSGNYDYLVLVVLAASVVLLAFVAGKRKRARFRL